MNDPVASDLNRHLKSLDEAQIYEAWREGVLSVYAKAFVEKFSFTDALDSVNDGPERLDEAFSSILQGSITYGANQLLQIYNDAAKKYAEARLKEFMEIHNIPERHDD